MSESELVLVKNDTPKQVLKRWHHWRTVLAKGPLPKSIATYFYIVSGLQLRDYYEELIAFVADTPEYQDALDWALGNEAIYKRLCEEDRYTWKPLPERR